MHDVSKNSLHALRQSFAAPGAQRGALVRERYDRLAPYVGLIDHILMMSMFRVRMRAIASLPLRRGDTVVELGCGSGRNFPYLRKAVGGGGRIVGVEFSPRMLERARLLAARERLEVALVEQDIAAMRRRRPIWCCFRCAITPWNTRPKPWDGSGTR